MFKKLFSGVLLFFLIFLSTVTIQMSKVAADYDETLYPWLSTGGVSLMTRGSQPSERLGCSSRSEEVVFRGGYHTIGCVYGEPGSVRVVSYTNQGGLSVLGIAFPGESEYSEVYGVCEASRFCAYSQSRNILVDSGTSRFYRNFTNSLTKKTNPVNGVPYYQFTAGDSGWSITVSGPMIFNAAAVSTGGKWAVVEAYEYGFVRVDLDTFHERRIAISGARYGVANDPSFEVAISNSGREFIAVGEKTGISLYQVDNYCGDVLGPGSMYYFMNPVVPCRQTPLTTDMFPGFIVAHTPKFNDRGTRVGLTVRTATGTERIIAAPTGSIPTDPSGSQYVALGDSYTSGEGESNDRFYKMGTDEATNRCHLSNRSYPYLLMPVWGVGTGRSVACSGAQMKDVFGIDTYYGQKNQIPDGDILGEKNKAIEDFMPGVVRQIEFVDTYQPSVVSVGIGGNDAGLMDKLNSCVGVGVCEWAGNPAKRLASAREIQSLYANFRAMVAALRLVAPDTRILFIGYPIIINPVSPGSCPLTLAALLAPEERMFMNESIRVLNDTIRAAARSEHVSYIDVQDAFNGHRLCEGTADAMNGIKAGNDIAPIESLPALKVIGSESFHPTPFGHELIARRILEQVSDISLLNCLGCTSGAGPGPLSAYWMSDLAEISPRKLLRSSFVSSGTYHPGQALPVRLSLMSLKPASEAVIKFDGRSVGAAMSGLTGGLEYVATIPLAVSDGYYTVTIEGESWTGDKIEVYQVIAVAGTDDDETFMGVPGVAKEAGSDKPSLAQGDRVEEGFRAVSTGQVAALGQGLFGTSVPLVGVSRGVLRGAELDGALPAIRLGPLLVVTVGAGTLVVCAVFYYLWRYVIHYKP